MSGTRLTGPAVGLSARVRHRHGDLRLEADLDVAPGHVVAVLGPNGAGKSTLLHVLAGLVRPDEGDVRLGERVLTGGGTHVPPEQRSVGLLGQDPLVFPHLTVRENVAFGPRAAGVPAGQARLEAERWLAAVGLEGRGDRRPHDLSGGQRQRVALARSLAATPAALLLDEPFAQLDVRTAAALRDVVRDQVRTTGTPTVLVTHDVLDVLALADHLLVLHEGRVVERGAPLGVLTDPSHPFTAAVAGVNLLTGRVERSGDAWVLRSGEVAVPCPGAAAGSRAQVTFAPSAVRVLAAADRVADRVADRAGAWASRVVDVENGPTGVRVRSAGDVLVDLPPVQAAGLDLRVGAPLVLGLDAADVRLRPLPA